jgi:hypothetical protein
VTSKPIGRRARGRVWLAGAAVVTAIVAVVVVLLVAGGTTTQRPAPLPITHPGRVGPESMFTAGSVATYTPQMLDELQALGIDSLHLYMHWNDMAPDPTAKHKPAFDANDPGQYLASGWAPFDQVVRQAAARKMGVDLDLVAPPPRWAAGPGAPKPANRHTSWKPNVALFAQWVHAAGVRYSGHYTPAGASSPLPRVHFWSVWSEPNIGVNLGPETTHAGSAVEVAPRLYRHLLNAAWTSLQATGHGDDRILVGELAPQGDGRSAPGLFNAMAPLRFLRALYCVDASYQQLRGTQASLRGCPATPAASARFATQNPGLFKASGLAVHPYSFTSLPPNVRIPNEPDYAELAAMPTLEATLDRLQRTYGSHKKFPIWSTEYGYLTNPPNPQYTVTPERAAYYLNWAEYMTWQDPRLKSFDQFLIADPPGTTVFATGLVTAAGQPKPGFYAFRMPLYLPVSTTKKGSPLVVWGGARGAPAADRSSHKRQVVQIQFRSGTSGAFRTVDRVPITNRHGYFEVHETFPASGQVRVAWGPPHGPQQFSRIADIALR